MKIQILPSPPRQTALSLIFALTSIFSNVLYGQNSPCLLFPPPGLDESQSLGLIIMDILPLGQRDTVFVSGPTVIRRSETMIDTSGKHFVPTQIVSMNLRGTSQLIGQVIVRLNPDMTSLGQITGLQIEPDLPASSYFDVFVEVTALGIVLHNVEPLHVEAEIDCIPPYGEPYHHFPGAGVNLFNAVGVAVAAIIEAVHKLETPVFSVVPGGNLDLVNLGPFEFTGRSFFGAGIVEPRPPTMGWPPIGRIEPPLLGLVPGIPGAVGDNLDGLSFGMDDIMAEPVGLEVFSFSVDNGSMGVPLSSVRFEFTTGTTFGPPDMAAPPEQVADVFFSPLNGNNFPMLDEKDPNCAAANMTVTNAIPTGAVCMLVGNPPGWPGGPSPENTDAIEISNVFQVGSDVDGDGNLDVLTAPVFFSIDAGSASVGMAVPDFRPAPPDGVASPDDILVAPPPGGFFGVYASGVLNMGLQAGDDVDAICLWDKVQLGFLDPVADEAYFSLAPASPSLGANSPADIFYTNFNGSFSLFTTAASIGLLPEDNVDALDCQCLDSTWLSGVKILSNDQRRGFKLYPGVPNPFSNSVAVTFDIPQHSHVTVKIHNLLGEEMATLVNEKLVPGTYRTIWDATGRENGVYFCTLTAGAFTETIKLILVE